MSGRKRRNYGLRRMTLASRRKRLKTFRQLVHEAVLKNNWPKIQRMIQFESQESKRCRKAITTISVASEVGVVSILRNMRRKGWMWHCSTNIEAFKTAIRLKNVPVARFFLDILHPEIPIAKNAGKRYDTNGVLYSKEDFVDFYGGDSEWLLATPVERKGALESLFFDAVNTYAPKKVKSLLALNVDVNATMNGQSALGRSLENVMTANMRTLKRFEFFFL
ncbi:hypothetical protein AAMO2058_000719200 [Amorphochlora amoebiformis]